MKKIIKFVISVSAVVATLNDDKEILTEEVVPQTQTIAYFPFDTPSLGLVNLASQIEKAGGESPAPG